MAVKGVPTIRRLRRARRAIGVLALPLGLAHAGYVAGAPLLHDHHETGLLSVDLPIEYHDHDFQVAPARGAGLRLLDFCPGCLVKAPAAPSEIDAPVAPNTVARRPAAREIDSPGIRPADSNPPRGPPSAREA